MEPVQPAWPRLRVAGRKLGSALRLVRSKGSGVALDVVRLRAAELFLARRAIPADRAALARLVGETLNRWGGLSDIAVAGDDLVGSRRSVLRPFVRHRFAESAAAAGGVAALTPLEAAVAADSALAVWDFEGIAEALPHWIGSAAGTAYARRVEQVGRRAALRLGRLREAARGCEDGGDDRGALTLRGDLLDALGRTGEAGAAYEAAIRRDGADAYTRMAYGFHLMKRGLVRDGLASWATADTLSGAYPLRHARPRWTGEPLGRRHLLLVFEHGLGDMIQVARFLPRLLAREPDAEITGRLPAPLLPLFARQVPRVRFIDEEAREPDYDLFLPTMHLAGVLDAADLEPRTRYIDLGPPPSRSGAKARVGVCWRGHPRQYEATRSVPLDLFARLFAAADADFVVLLNSVTPEERRRLDAEPNVSTPAIRDFVDLAAQTASCDLVVTVDTAVGHLAGAGGVATLLLSRPDSCWRWGTAGPEAPWYETVEVLRHGGDMDWPRLLDAAASRIRARCCAPAAA